MIDFEAETALTARQAAARFPGTRGKGRLDPFTVVRWIRRGVRGVKLRGSLVGGTWYTSVEALREFAAGPGGQSPPPRPTRRGSDAIAGI